MNPQTTQLRNRFHPYLVRLAINFQSHRFRIGFGITLIVCALLNIASVQLYSRYGILGTFGISTPGESTLWKAPNSFGMGFPLPFTKVNDPPSPDRISFLSLSGDVAFWLFLSFFVGRHCEEPIAREIRTQQCQACGYNLRTQFLNRTGTCPECGTVLRVAQKYGWGSKAKKTQGSGSSSPS